MRKPGTPDDFIVKRVSKYGDLFRSHVLGKNTVVVTNPRDAKYVLNNEWRYFRAAYPPRPLKNILGKWSIVYSKMELWKKQRQVLLGFVHSRLKHDLLENAEAVAVEELSSWKTPSVVRIYTAAQTVIFSVMIRELLSLKRHDQHMQELLDSFRILIDGVTLPIYCPGTRYYKALQARKKILAILSDLVKHRKALKTSDDPRDFLDVLLMDGTLEGEQILDFIIGAIFGGLETTSVVITMALKFMSQHPEVLAQLREEHQLIRKMKQHGEKLTWEDYSSMSYTQNVIFEVIRLSNPAGLVMRKVQEEVGRFPKDWSVIVSLTAANSNSELYPDPYKFNPERWETASLSRDFLGFGGGARKCPGAEVAKMQTCIFLHHFITRFSWKEVHEPQEFSGIKFPDGHPVQIDILEQF